MSDLIQQFRQVFYWGGGSYFETPKWINNTVCHPCVSVILLCMHSVLIGGEEQATLLTKALEMGLADGRYVFVPYDTLLYSLPYQNNSFNIFDNDSKLQEAYDAVLTVTLESGERTFIESFREAKESGEITIDLEDTQVNILSLRLFWDLVMGDVRQAIVIKKVQVKDNSDCMLLF